MASAGGDFFRCLLTAFRGHFGDAISIVLGKIIV
jgi:hypothetical protein